MYNVQYTLYSILYILGLHGYESHTGSQWIQPESDEAYKTAYNLPMGDSNTKLDLYYPFFLTVQAGGAALPF